MAASQEASSPDVHRMNVSGLMSGIEHSRQEAEKPVPLKLPGSVSALGAELNGPGVPTWESAAFSQVFLLLSALPGGERAPHL